MCNTERQLDILCKIDSIKNALELMCEGGDISQIYKKLLIMDLNSLELQVKNIDEPFEEIEK